MEAGKSDSWPGLTSMDTNQKNRVETTPAPPVSQLIMLGVDEQMLKPFTYIFCHKRFKSGISTGKENNKRERRRTESNPTIEPGILVSRFSFLNYDSLPFRHPERDLSTAAQYESTNLRANHDWYESQVGTKASVEQILWSDQIDCISHTHTYTYSLEIWCNHVIYFRKSAPLHRVLPKQWALVIKIVFSEFLSKVVSASTPQLIFKSDWSHTYTEEIWKCSIFIMKIEADNQQMKTAHNDASMGVIKRSL